jgi:hypothetical protein
MNLDNLISSLTNFTIYGDAEIFENDLDDIINKLNKQKIESNENEGPNEIEEQSDSEWLVLRENYSKIKKLNEIIRFQIHEEIDTYKTFGNEKFKLILEQVMKEVDDANVHYIHSINWIEAINFLNCSNRIEYYLNASINTNNLYEKITLCEYAYDLLIPAVEKFRGEKYDYSLINDTEFVEQIDSFKRKRT